MSGLIAGILKTALSVLPKREALLFRWTGRTTNARGLHEDAFAPAEVISGSIQPVDRSRYGYFGLDGAKGYITVYADALISDLTRTGNPDQIEYRGRRYRVMNRTEWHETADFNGVLAEDIGPAVTETP
ncbi:MAG: hypothetical protein LBB66_10420 [Desulfovibrio sp.]|jgi:hypothetical protein|nr:hypothetical protein [Desulfovibrio sp.]